MNITKSLEQNAKDKPDFKAINIGLETGITFQAYEFVISAGPNDFIPIFYRDAYKVGMEVWAEENMPTEWKDFLIETIKLREAKGIRSHLRPFSCVLQIIDEDTATREIVQKNFDLEEINPDEIILDADIVKNIFNLFLNNTNLRKKLQTKLIDFVYIRSASWVYPDDVTSFINKIKLKDGFIIDIGCGIGDHTNNLSKNNIVIGLDRQYVDASFGEEWKEGKNHFLQAEGEHLPFGQQSIDMVVMTSVVGHLAGSAIQNILDEITRTLKVGGHLAVGPQNNSESSYYRFFQKNIVGELVELS